jgi:hypothetical protein
LILIKSLKKKKKKKLSPLTTTIGASSSKLSPAMSTHPHPMSAMVRLRMIPKKEKK